MPWTNQKAILYHGTDSGSVASISAGINLSKSQVDRDFGPGFYLTEHLQAASNRALSSANKMNNTPAVLEFAVDRDELAKLDIVIFGQPSLDFWNFVNHFRIYQSDSDMRGSPPGTVEDYDVAFGPVTLRDRMVFRDYDQYCFRTPDAIRLLTNPRPAKVLPFRALPIRPTDR